MEYSIYPHGLLRNVPKIVGSAKVGNGEKRGKITCFSDHSRLRLRKWLLFRFIPGARMWGVTLTIPAQEDVLLAVSRFGSAVHRLRVYFLRRFPSSGYIWRVELQQNKMPHLHMVVYTSVEDVPSKFLRLWSDIVRPLFVVPSLDSFLRYGVLCNVLDGDIRAYRYLCDHGSKRKQAQLGWQGRQWGVVGRDHFQDRDRLHVTLDERLDVLFRRFLRRLMSFSVKAESAPFGNRLVRLRGVNSVCYVKAETVEKWLAYHDLPF